MVYEKPSPYDMWERFKLPLHMRILIFLLTKEERKNIEKRINNINRIRRKEKAESINEMRKRIRPQPQRRPGQNFPEPQKQKYS